MPSLGEKRPASEFHENAPEFSRRLKETGRPIVLTVDGEAAVVVQDIGAYRKMLDELDHLRTMEGIRQGLEDMRAGRTTPADEAFAHMRRVLGLLDHAEGTPEQIGET
jgi:PHD/YefM family antitoxin component YafN of YafNO toxin-antitoxin module